ncbi:MAG: hypothetical protein SEPTF4163_005039 [Sporothrix epigloea]
MGAPTQSRSNGFENTATSPAARQPKLTSGHHTRRKARLLAEKVFPCPPADLSDIADRSWVDRLHPDPVPLNRELTAAWANGTLESGRYGGRYPGGALDNVRSAGVQGYRSPGVGEPGTRVLPETLQTQR